MMVSGFMAFAHGIFLPFNTLFQDNTLFENLPQKTSKSTKNRKNLNYRNARKYFEIFARNVVK